MNFFITKSAKETQKLGEEFAHLAAVRPLRPLIIALEGDLGSGKTTFTQGLLKGLGARGPYASPTFVVIKQYKLKAGSYKLKAIYHIDTYRVKSKDILNLGWEEITKDKNNIIIIEWADRIKKIIPKDSIWIKFKWLDKNKREITLASS